MGGGAETIRGRQVTSQDKPLPTYRNSRRLTPPKDKPLWPAPRPRRFPLYWTIGVAALWALVQFLPITRDYKVVAGQVSAGLLAVGLIGWFVLRGPARRAVRRRVGLAAALLVVAVVVGVRLKTDGDGRVVGWRFRWAPRPDETLQLPVASGGAATEDDELNQASYPAFLGGGYWAEVSDVRLAGDWRKSPPEQLWRRPLGAGWSAFAVADGLAVTQEQRDEQELVVAYRLADGEVAWWHGDRARFDPFGPTQRMGGVGPRATPTIHAGRVYTQGATGIVNCLDLATGEVIWSRDTLADFAAPNLMWGKSNSPLVIPEDNLVVIAVGDDGDGDDPLVGSSLVAMDLATGETHWEGGGRITAYATPVLATLAGRRQLLQVNHNFLTAHDAATSRVLWEFPWPGSSNTNASCSQPIPLAGDRIFLSKGYSIGSVLLEISESEGEFSADIVWQKRVMKTKFGNVILHDGHVYGLDGVLLQCVELATGKSVWKHRRTPSFGHGQLMLVGDRLLILTEWGEVVLADASPEGYQERAALQVFDESEITWNNPAMAGPYLLIRNSVEAACLRLPIAEEE